MRKSGANLVVLSTSLIVIAACARREGRVAPAPAPAPRLATPSAPPNPVLSSAAYIAMAASIELYEIRSAELALERSHNIRVREFASTALNNHKGASMQLSLAGRRLNLLPSATLNATHTAMLAQLRSAPDFDSAYRRQQTAVHQDGLKIHRNYAARGTSPTLRPVAKAMVPTFERELRLLRSL